MYYFLLYSTSERKLSFVAREVSRPVGGIPTIEVLNTTLAGSGRRNEFECS